MVGWRMKSFTRTLSEALALVLLTGVATAATYFWHPHRPALYLTQEPTVEGEISLAAARVAEKQPGVIWVDARTRSSFNKGHVPGALLLSQHEPDWQDLLLTVANTVQEAQAKLVVVYCDAKKCEASRDIADYIRGFHPDPERVKVLHGGWAVIAGK